MALDLFANFERVQNSSMFYRVTSNSPYTINFKLSNLFEPNRNYSSLFVAKSSLNNGTFQNFITSSLGTFETSLTFSCQTPRVCSFAVQLSTLPDYFPLPTFQISAIFVPNFPQAEFVMYPKYSPVVDENNVPQINLINEDNYTESPGTSFYGEGHTEVYNLCCNVNSAELSSLWFVGNDIINISKPDKPASFIETLDSIALRLNSTVIEISTVPLEQTIYPVSLMYHNHFISTKSPIITYQDSGHVAFYPYFTSTLNVFNQPSISNYYLKDSIKVLPYPEAFDETLQSPFVFENFNLPFDSEPVFFLSYVNVPKSVTPLTENYVGSEWSIQARSAGGEWGDDEDVLTNTPLLSSIYAYYFQLAYDNIQNDILDYFRTSPTQPTTISLNVKAFKDIKIDLDPFDWLQRRSTRMFSTSAVIDPLPFTRIYTPNYFNSKDTPVIFEVLSDENTSYKLNCLKIFSDKSTDSITLTSTPLSGVLNFDKIGIIDLNVFVSVTHIVTEEDLKFSVSLQNFIEVVEQLDVVEPLFYQTNLTDINLPFKSNPRFSPNEWVTEDNINDVITKLYTISEKINRFTKLYERKTCHYGWIGTEILASQNRLQSTDDVPIYVWMDVECPRGISTPLWLDFECDLDNISSSKTWEYHECAGEQIDPTCFGKHCVEWKWRSRKRTVGNLFITWKDAQCDQPFNKKWKFERCDSDADPLNCSRDTWKISNIDQQSFPLSQCISLTRCKYVDVDYYESGNLMILAYPTEIQLATLNYDMKYVSRRGKADELFSFQKIVGVDLGIQEELFVLDSTLSKVSVFLIKDNNFELFVTWGRFGFKSNPLGLNKPNDIHVDQNNNVWIADTGNKCIKKFTFNGKNLKILDYEKFETNIPLSVCVDSIQNVHVLSEGLVMVFDYEGNFIFDYELPTNVKDVKKINTNYNRETIYITYDTGIVKYFRTGIIAYYIVHEHECSFQNILKGYDAIIQDKYRNLYVTLNDKLLKIQDLMSIIDIKATASADLYWNLDQMLVNKEEYVQPWVYLKAFHRLWDNVELLRNSLFYRTEGCKAYVKPVFQKEDLIIGQNEIVSNAVLNRLVSQIWANIETLFRYFDPLCESQSFGRQPLNFCTKPTSVIVDAYNIEC